MSNTLDALMALADKWANHPEGFGRNDFEDALSSALAARVPAGWRMVPEEATPEMLAHADRTLSDAFSIGDEYRAMLAAAPPAPAEVPMPAAKIIGFSEDSSTGTVEFLAHTGQPLHLLQQLYAAPAPEVPHPVAQSDDPENDPPAREGSDWSEPVGYDGDGSVAAMAARAVPQPVAPFLFIAMDDDKHAHLTWCADAVAVHEAVKAAMFFSHDGAELDADHAEQLAGCVDELMDSGAMTFEGDPPLYLYRVAGAQPPAEVAAEPVTSPHLRAMATAVLRQLDETHPREEIDLDAVGLLCRVIVGGHAEGTAPQSLQKPQQVGAPQKAQAPTLTAGQMRALSELAQDMALPEDERLAVALAYSALEAVAQKAQAPEWRPIETAPKDSKARLVWVPENKCVFCVSWRAPDQWMEGPGGWIIFGGSFREHLQGATHWMPLPSAPSTGSTGEQA